MADKKHDKKPERRPEEVPAAGPHARPSLTNPDLTPGAGSLPPADEPDDPNMQPTS